MSIILERFLNILPTDLENKKKYLDDVKNILEFSYASEGGVASLDSGFDELLDSKYFWKLVKKDGKIVAAVIYKFGNGGSSRKLSLAGSDGTPAGKEALYSIFREDAKLSDRKAWGEYSGALAHILTSPKYGINAKIIPNTEAREILKKMGKVVTSLDDDGQHYTRKIGGKDFKKIMLGNVPDIFPALTDTLKEDFGPDPDTSSSEEIAAVYRIIEKNKEQLLTLLENTFTIYDAYNGSSMYLLPDGRYVDTGDAHMNSFDFMCDYICKEYDVDEDFNFLRYLPHFPENILGVVHCGNKHWNYLGLPEKEITPRQYVALKSFEDFFKEREEGFSIEVYSRDGRPIHADIFYDEDIGCFTNRFWRKVSLEGYLKNFYTTGSFKLGQTLEEQLLLEKTRSQLISKSRNSDDYAKGNQARGKNRWERRKYSKISTSVADYNKIDMNAFWKGDMLEFGIKVQGETDNYVVTVLFEHILDRLADEVKRNKNKLEFKCILRALIDTFNSTDVYVHCSCLHPDTRIKLLDGTTPTVAEMKERFDKGDQLYVYSTDAKGDFKPGIVEKVWITKKESNLIKITLDNGESITTTLDHPYMLRDGSYELAQNLAVGESLMPMYFNSSNGYETVKLNSEERGWRSVYKLVANEFKKAEIEEAKLRAKPDDNMTYAVAIHHQDFNKKNNTPENLQIMTAKEHWDYHAHLCGQNKPITDKMRETSRQNAIKRNANPTEKMLTCRKAFIEKGHESAQFRNHDPECLKKQAELMSKSIKNYYNTLSDEEREQLSLVRSGTAKHSHERGCYDTEAFHAAAKLRGQQMHTPEREKLARDGVINYYSNPDNKAAHTRKTLETKIRTILYTLIDKKLNLTEANYELVRKELKGYPRVATLFRDIDEAVSYFNINHKIVAIEYITLDEPIDVYDIKVKDWENFVVDAGVVLHNCPDFTYRQDYWSTRGDYNSGIPQFSNGKGIANPNDTKGAGCKHINLILANLSWMMKIAAVINNYVEYCKNYMEVNYAKYIFPKLYGMDYDDAIQLTLFDTDELVSDPETINLANAIGRRRTQYKKKPEKSVNPRRFENDRKQRAPEDEPGQLKLDLEQE